MADVLHLKDKGIPLKIDGSTRYVRGATKYTTCGDVIKMVLKKTGVKKEYRHLFAIYEVSADTEKALPCKSKIVKVIESWRGKPNKLVLRKLETHTPDLLNEKKKRWNLKRRSRQEVPEAQKFPDLQTLNSLAEMVEKRRCQLQKDSNYRHDEKYVDSTSDSDSSMDELLSKLDHSKIAGLLNFFATVALKKHRRHSYRRSTSGSSHESGDSSDSSPVRPRRRRTRSSRQTLVTKTKFRNSRCRLRECADLHPNKMHAVNRVNFGFIDVEPRSHDRVYSLSDIRSGKEQAKTVRPHATKIFSARRRLIPGKRYNYNEQDKNKVEVNPTFRRTDSDDISNGLTGAYNVKKLSENCKEIWCESPIHSVDSGHDADSDVSTDMDTAFVLRNNTGDVIKTHRYMKTPEHGCIFPNSVQDKPFTSSARKLVEYSITDDEFDTSDIVNVTETSETDDDNNEDSELPMRVNELGIISAMTECRELWEYRENNTEDCAKHLKKNFIRNHKEINHNISDYIKSVFGKEVQNEDEEMNSFMKSMVLDDSSDEGLSSMGSDLEKDVGLRL